MALEDTILTYVSDAEIDEFFQALLDDGTWTYTNIPVIVRGDGSNRGSAFESLRAELDGYVDAGNSTEETILYNGSGQPELFVKFPIVDIDSITVLEPDTTETALDLEGADKDVEIFHKDGLLTLHRDRGIAGAASSDSGVSNWPLGLENIRIVGTFGYVASPIFKYAQLLYMLQAMAMYNPDTYQPYLSMAKSIEIGRYQEAYGDAEAKAGSVSGALSETLKQIRMLTGGSLSYESI